MKRITYKTLFGVTLLAAVVAAPSFPVFLPARAAAAVHAPTSANLDFVGQRYAQGDVKEWLQAVRRATARFHSKRQALRAGYVRNDHCVSFPGLGGMGYHWLNPSLLDDVFDPLQPEVVLYATGDDGELKLVAIEYIVLDVGQERPEFAGYLFDIGGTPLPVPHYSLHVWLYEENSNGIFAPINPNISCP
jgi:hypothetical protein